MKNLKEMSLQEVGGYICNALIHEGIHVVLSGGSCVEIYSQGDYTSQDMDFINKYNEKKSKIKQVMLNLGFYEYERYFVHDDITHIIEFPPGPLGVGDAPVDKISSIKTKSGVLTILTPTDCIKDRLAAYYHWNDEQCLQQAVWVADKNEFDLDSIKRWSYNESMQSKYQSFQNKLKTAQL